MKALVTDGGYLHTVGIVRYLGLKGVDVHVLGSFKWNNAFFSKYCKKEILTPDPIYDENAYIEFLEQIIKNEYYNILMPVGFQTTKIIAKNRDRLEKYVKVELAPYEAIERAMDKSKTYEIAERLGIPFPQTIYPKTFEEVERLSNNLDYPVVIKGLFEAGKQVIAHPRNREEFLTQYFKLCEENNFTEGTLPMIQEFIGKGGNECLAALYQEGKAKRIVVYKAIRCFPIKGGASSCATTFYDDEIVEKGTKLLNELNWHGVADVEFKRDRRSGELKLMEVNPKFYATVEVAMRAGMNFPYYLCQMARGEYLRFSDDYNRNLIYNYPFSKELIHLKEKPISIFRIIIATLNPKVKSNVWLTDFKPNVFELLFQLLLFLPKGIKRFIKIKYSN